MHGKHLAPKTRTGSDVPEFDHAGGDALVRTGRRGRSGDSLGSTKARGWLVIAFAGVGCLAVNYAFDELYGPATEEGLTGAMILLGFVGFGMVFGAWQVGWLLIILGVGALSVFSFAVLIFGFRWPRDWASIVIPSLAVMAGLILRAFGRTARKVETFER